MVFVLNIEFTSSKQDVVVAVVVVVAVYADELSKIPTFSPCNNKRKFTVISWS